MTAAATLVAAKPRRRLFSEPSPLQRLRRLEAAICGDFKLYAKRDDRLWPLCGNKIRYLEFALGAYDAAGADCLVHCGGRQSNYLAQIALVTAELGIPAHLIILSDPPTRLGGNTLIEHVCGARLYFRPGEFGLSCSAYKKELATRLRAEGRKPYVIDHPDGNFHGFLAYMSAYDELMAQCREAEASPPAAIYLCSGFASALGLAVGAALASDDVPIVAYPPETWARDGLRHFAPDMRTFLGQKLEELSGHIGTEVGAGAIRFDESQVGEGYGHSTEAGLAAIELAARTEGLILDPVYTGKAMAGLIADARAGRIPSGSSVVFIHTGGIGNLFDQADVFASRLTNNPISA